MSHEAQEFIKDITVDGYAISEKDLPKELVNGICLDYGYTLALTRDGVRQEAYFSNEKANPFGKIDVEYRLPVKFETSFDPAEVDCPISREDAPTKFLLAMVWSELAKAHRLHHGKRPSMISFFELSDNQAAQLASSPADERVQETQGQGGQELSL